MLQESYSLAQDLAQLVDGARAAEARMVEVSALSSTFAAHVAAQAQQIEALCVISFCLLRCLCMRMLTQMLCGLQVCVRV